MKYKDLSKPFFALAPMDDVTDTAFRQVIATTAKPDLFFTEFVNVDGLQSPGRAKLLHKLQFIQTEQPIIAQIWGKNPENYYKTAKELIKMDFTGIDINMGCPDKKVVKNGCGSALINNRPLAAEIIKATKKGAGGKLPVSVKLRIGFGDVDLTWPEFILNQGVDMLTVHGRTTRQMSKGSANWTHIAKVADMASQIAPKTLVMGNGDVESRLQGVRLAKKHGLDGIMIGRGVFSDPYIFARNSPWAKYSPTNKLQLYKNQITIFANNYKNGEKSIQSLKKFAKIYINGFEGASDLRAQFMKSNTTDEMIKALQKT